MGLTLSIAAPHSPISGTDCWLTPPEILRALGEFDLDPAAAPLPRPWPTARRMISLPQDGLAEPWEGRCWVNPPYGRMTGAWLSRLADHGHGVALIFARTETATFFEYVWKRATGVLFLEGRLTFCKPDGSLASGNAGGPSCLVSYGEHDAAVLEACELPGAFLDLNGYRTRRGPAANSTKCSAMSTAVSA